jgi:long-chain acyl-CoA synthetase
MLKTFEYLEEFRGKLFFGEIPTVPELFTISATRYPDSKCFTVFTPAEKTLTYSQAKEKIFIFAQKLIEKGIQKGEHVVLTGKNSPEWTVAYLAIHFAGGVVIPLDHLLTETEAENLIYFTATRILISDEEKYDTLKGAPGKETVKFSLSPKKENYIFDLTNKQIEEPVKLDIEDIAVILFTSGTTGNSKGVMLSHSNLVNDALIAQAHLTVLHEDVFYALLPLHHTYTMLAVFIETIAAGSSIVFASKLVVKQMLVDMKEGKVTLFLGVPMLFNKLLKGILKGIKEKGIILYALIRILLFISGKIKIIFGKKIGKHIFKTVLEKASLSSIRVCISGGGPLSPSVFSIYNQLGIDFIQGYGLTETSPIVALNPIERFKVKSVGKIIPQIEAKIINPDASGRGEIAIRGPVVMKGYYKNEEATKEIMTDDGFLLTGDIGYLDSENYLFLTGRKKSIIVTEGGKNVFPEEIEDKFQLYDEFEQVFVRGYIKDKKNLTEEIEAFFYPSEELRNKYKKEEIQEITKKIVNEVNKKLLTYMEITKIKILDSPLEETSAKKIKRYKVKD